MPCSPVAPTQNSTNKRQLVTTSSKMPLDNANNQKAANKVPPCLTKLVRSIIRTFYSREHSLIVDMLVRNTIMKEDDLCERLRFEKKQLRQYLHTLKTDQFIKSKLQLETDADGKTTKITHYFIEYKLFVNVVKYRLDQMQRRLETEQRQTTSRATFKCAGCNTTYTDLEVDRLLDLTNPGKLVCVYCRGDVLEEEDNASRTDARALIAKFHRQVRDPIDEMLRECDEIHLSSSILEPEIRPLESINDSLNDSRTLSSASNSNRMQDDLNRASNRSDLGYFGPTESKVRIVLGSQSDDGSMSLSKQHPVWMTDSTVGVGYNSAMGELDRGPGTFSASATTNPVTLFNTDSITQTLTPGRVPTANSSSANNSGSNIARPSASDSTMTDNGTANAGDIMQLLLVHERRGLPGQNNSTKRPLPSSATESRTSVNRNSLPKSSVNESHVAHAAPNETNASDKPEPRVYTVQIGDRSIPYKEISSAMIKAMTPQERSEYIRVGKQIYAEMMVE